MNKGVKLALIFMLLAIILVFPVAVAEKTENDTREIFAYQGDVAWFLEDEKYGLINREGAVLLEPVLLHVEPFDANGFAVVEVPGETSLEKLGIVDKAGQWFLEPKYYEISRHGDEGEYFFIVLDDLSEPPTIINIKGEGIFPSDKYYLFRVASIHEGIIIEDDEESREYINFDGEKLFEKIDWNANREPGNEVEGEDWEWYAGTDFHEGLAAIWVNNSCWYYINTKGEAVISKACYIDGQYDWLDEMYADLPSDFKDGMALVKTKYGEWMFINAQEELAVPGIWEGAKGFGEFDLAPVKKDGLWGFINKQGEMVLPKIWEGAREFGEFGLAPVKKDGLWGYINEQGETVIEPQWANALSFKSGLAIVQHPDSELWGYINEKGDAIIPLEYTQVYPFEYGSAEVRFYEQEEDGRGIYKIGYINMQGELVYKNNYYR